MIGDEEIIEDDSEDSDYDLDGLDDLEFDEDSIDDEDDLVFACPHCGAQCDDEVEGWTCPSCGWIDEDGDYVDAGIPRSQVEDDLNFDDEDDENLDYQDEEDSSEDYEY